MVIDIHTHVFPDKIAARAVSGLQATSGLTPVLGGTLAELRASMHAEGVDLSVLMPIATSARMVVSCNDAAIASNGLSDIRSFGTMHPDFEDMEGELDRVKEAGLRGIKLHPDFQKAYIDSPKMLRIMKLCRDRGLLVMLHGGADISYPEINRSTPERLARVLGQLEGVKLICAHLGGFGYLKQSIRCLSRTDVYIDTSAVEGIFADDAIKRVIDAFGTQRVLLGSDSPWSRQRDNIALVKRLKLTDDELRAVLGGNAERLLTQR